jgi:hypothetical protein
MIRWPLHSSHTLGGVQVQQAGPPRTDAASSTSEQYNVALRERSRFIREQQDASTALGKVLVMRNKAAVLFDTMCAPHASTFAALQICRGAGLELCARVLMHLYNSGDGDDSDGTTRRAFHSGEMALAGVQARRNNITDLAPLEARYASAKANVREVMQRMQQLNRQYHQVWLHVQVVKATAAAGQTCLHIKVCMALLHAT